METVTIYGNVTSIEILAFQDCSSLEKVSFETLKTQPTCSQYNTFPDRLSFVNVAPEYTGNTLCGKPVVKQSNTDYSCGNYCRWGYDESNRIMKFKSTAGMTTIKANSTYHVYKEVVQTIIIDEYIQSIEEKAFEWYPNLKIVKIGKHVKNIGKNAFNGCAYLDTVTFEGETLTCGENAFYSTVYRINVTPSYKGGNTICGKTANVVGNTNTATATNTNKNQDNGSNMIMIIMMVLVCILFI